MRAMLFETVAGFAGAVLFSLGGVAAILTYVRAWYVTCGICVMIALCGVAALHSLRKSSPRW